MHNTGKQYNNTTLTSLILIKILATYDQLLYIYDRYRSKKIFLWKSAIQIMLMYYLWHFDLYCNKYDLHTYTVPLCVIFMFFMFSCKIALYLIIETKHGSQCQTKMLCYVIYRFKSERVTYSFPYRTQTGILLNALYIIFYHSWECVIIYTYVLYL